jgi:DNA-binding beta-propeller fold protein YncE
MLVANESQETIGVFDEATGRHLRDVDLKTYGIRPRGLKVSPQGNEYAVTMESSGTLLTMDANFKVIKSVPRSQALRSRISTAWVSAFLSPLRWPVNRKCFRRIPCNSWRRCPQAKGAGISLLRPMIPRFCWPADDRTT